VFIRVRKLKGAIMKFSGFGDWIEIFKGGKQIDSAGEEHDGDAVIDTIIAKFNATKHEPPAVIGHPKDNDPAYGWVEGVKTVVKDGVKVLLARFKQVVPEFEDMVKKGMFKKRSISVYPDGSLRHVGFLGAAPPAVKGLADLKFEDGEAMSFEFSDTENINPNQGGNSMDKFKEFLEMLKFWKAFEKEMAPSTGDDKDRGNGGQAYTEADLEQIKKDAKEEGKKAAEAAFAESKKTAATEARKKEIADYIEQGIKDGKILPAEKDAGLALFMEGLAAEEPVQFNEGEKGKKTPLDFFKEHLERYSAMPLFKEFATKEKGGNVAEFAEAKADEETAKRILKHVGVTE
jgi:hypothetical protein